MIKEYFSIVNKADIKNACAQLGIKNTSNRMYYVYSEDDIIRCGIEYSVSDNNVFIYGISHRDFAIDCIFLKRYILAFINYAETLDAKRIVVKANFFSDKKEYTEMFKILGFSLQSRGDMTFIF